MPAGENQRVRLGLTRRLTEFLANDVYQRRQLKDACPGQGPCEENGRIALWRAEDSTLPILDLCNVKGCELLPTKPGTEPPDLLAVITRAYDLAGLHAAGATFSYPDALPVADWACLRAYQAALNRADAREEQTKAQQHGVEQSAARLDAIRRGR